MHPYQLIIIVALFLLLLKTKRNGEISSIIAFHIASVAMYSFISEDYYSYYYTAMCGVSLVTGLILQDQFKVAALCAYTLVPVNVLGYFLWYRYYPHDLYNAISAILLIIQFISILPKALLNGMDANNTRRSLDVPVHFDSCSTHDTMYKTSQNKEALCEKK